MSQPSFDASALTEPVTPAALSAYQREQKARGLGGSRVGQVFGTIVYVLVGVILLPAATAAILSPSSPSTWRVAMPLGIVAYIVVGIVLIVSARRRRTARYRLDHFATANGMTYVDSYPNPPLPGMIFTLGSSRLAENIVRGTSPRFVEFANYQYTVRSGKNSTTHTWGYVAVKLDVPLPNIVLDAVGNNSFLGSNLPATFKRAQKLSLEGDFDKHFSLYCPAGYEQDALYLFTPDIMARFIDHAAQLDVEIVDDWMFLYTRRPVSTLDPKTWAWLFGIVGALMTKFDQWARWRDDRLRVQQGAQAVSGAPVASAAMPFAAPAGMLTPPPGVAHEGRRLRKGVNWVAIGTVVVFAIVWFLLRR